MGNTSTLEELYADLITTRQSITSWMRTDGESVYEDVQIETRIQTSGDRKCWVTVRFAKAPIKDAGVTFEADAYIKDRSVYVRSLDQVMMEHYFLPSGFPAGSEDFHQRLLNESIKIVMRNLYLIYRNRITTEPEWVEDYIKNMQELVIKRVTNQ